MGWAVFLGPLVVLGILVWRREHRGSRSGFGVRGERNQDAVRQADMELRTSSGRIFTKFPGGG